ncbi:glycosyltransferase [Rhodococcus sp. NPDC060090]|uniref:glycosyltransferase n=1 Tax=Rhodococcus sp. NPDC060090 TaxID=3347056 RepID=UPI00364CF4A7
MIVCVARLVRRKGQDALIRALPMIRDRHPDTRLVSVGDGPRRRDLRALVPLMLLDDPDAATRMGSAGREWAQSWAWDATWKTLAGLLE